MMKFDRRKVSNALLYLFIALLPIQLGTFFFFTFSYISGVKIDYLAPTLYLTDLIVVIIILLNVSSFKKPNKLLLIFLGLILVNISLSFSPFIGLYRLAKLVEVFALFMIIKSTNLDYKKILFVVLGSSILELLISIIQMVRGSSIQGLMYFLGERNFNLSTASIAKVSFDGMEILRPYGTFSHPNSLAGFYLLLYTFILFSDQFSKYTKLKYTILGVISLLIFLSFSKVAILTYVFITILYSIKDTKKICLLCSVSKIAVVVVIALLFLRAHGDSQTIAKRLYLMQSSIKIIVAHPLTGTGLGNYLYAQSKIPNPYPYHFLEPVHNIEFLSLAELGIPLFLFSIYFLFLSLKKYWYTDVGKAMIFVIILTGMFDHYWLTLQQNILLLPVLFGLLKNAQRYDKIERT